MITHSIGRVAGPLWLIFGLVGYFFYRNHKKLPVFRSRKHDWMEQQITILRDAGELELMDELIVKLRDRSGAVPASEPAEGAGVP